MKAQKDPLIVLPAYDFERTMATIIETIHRYQPQTKSDLLEYDPDEIEDIKEYLRWLWEWTRQQIKYKLDAPLKEEIRTPARTWYDKKTGVDCEDYCIFLSTILLNSNIKHSLRVADYGSGWSHIYIVVKDKNTEIILDAVNPVFDTEKPFVAKKDYPVKPSKGLSGINAMQLELKLKNKGLGKLPANLYTDRERFILNLWQSLLIKGKKYEKDQEGQYRTKPFEENEVKDLIKQINQEGMASATYVEPTQKDGFTILKNLQGKKEVKKNVYPQKIDARIKVTFKSGSTFTFLPDKLPELAYQIGGKEVFEKPQANGDGLSPANRKLMEFLKPFISKDELRPQMQGAYFDKSNNAVTATDGHRIAVVFGSEENRVNQDGIYTPSGVVINDRFPQYQGAIRGKDKGVVFLTVDPKLLLDTINKVLPFANKTSKQILLVRSGKNTLKIKAEDLDYSNETSLYATADFEGKPFEEIGFNGKYLTDGLKQIVAVQKEKNAKIRIEFETPNRAIEVYFESVFGSALFLIMPVQRYNLDTDPEEYKPEKEETAAVNKSIALKIKIRQRQAKSKLNLLKL